MSRTEDVNDRISETRIPDTGKEFWIVAAREMDFVHRIDALFFYLSVSDKRVPINVLGWKRDVCHQRYLQQLDGTRRFSSWENTFERTR